jgi:catechol 2,3-dioxygenase-like lactoylglutathione lyase family enzyme
MMRLSLVTIFVHDQDEALRFYTEKLGLEKRADDVQTVLGFRWLTVAPKDQKEPELVLLKAVEKEQVEQIGKQSHLGFSTEDCRRTYETLSARAVKFTSAPEDVGYGVQALFEDLYGNEYVLIETRNR